MQITRTVTGSEPLTLTEVKEALKIDYTDEDIFLTRLISAARIAIEKFTSRCFIASTFEYYRPDVVRSFWLPFPNHSEVETVTVNGVETTDFIKDGLTQFRIKINTIVSTNLSGENGIYVKYTASGSDPEMDFIKTEMLRLIDEKYRNRGNTFEGSIVNLDENAFVNLAQFVV